MLKVEMKKRLASIEGTVYGAQLEAEALLSDLEEDQGRISDDDVDVISSFASNLDSARASTFLR